MEIILIKINQYLSCITLYGCKMIHDSSLLYSLKKLCYSYRKAYYVNYLLHQEYPTRGFPSHDKIQGIFLRIVMQIEN